MTSTAAGLDSLGVALAAAAKGEFSILGALGRGGMAAVYLAHDRGLDRKVAIKVLLPDLLAHNPAAADRFVLEARTAAGLAHPYIVPIHTVRRTGDLHWFAMGFVDGWPLDVILRERGALPGHAVRTVLAQMAQALAFSHRKGVVHRDLKPGNVIVDVEGRAIVLDFGIAKVAEKPGMTQAGTAIGTPTYMSPEQCRGLEATSASDQYSLGIVAYELLAGAPPFASENTFGLIYSHVHESPPPLAERCRQCPAEVAAAVMRMLAKEPTDRWPSLAALAEALGAPQPSDEAAVRELLYGDGDAPVMHPAVAALPTPPSPTRATGDARFGPKTRALAEAIFGKAPPAPPSRAPARAPALTLEAIALGMLPEPAVEPVPEVVVVPPPIEVSGTDAPKRTDETQTNEVPLGPIVLELAPRRGTLTLGQSLSLTALLARPLPAGYEVRWSSEDPGIVRVSDDGRATAERTGVVTVLVTDGVGEARARLEVTRVDVAKLTLTAPSPSMSVGDAMTLVATAFDRLGTRLEHRIVEWRSSDPRRATVTSTGMVTARGPGTVTIIARCGSLTEEVDLVIGPERLTGVLVLPRNLALVTGQRAQLQALALTARGQSRTVYPVSWATSDPAVVQVNADGVVLAGRKGIARISAVIEGWRGYVPVEVRAVGER